MEEDNYVVKPWGRFKLELCNLLESEELRKAKLLVRGRISESRREKLSEHIDLLEALEDANIISEDSTDALEEILKAIDNVEALEELAEYRTQRTAYLKQVKLLSGKHDPLFVGRDDYIRKIIDVFGRSADFVSCVCLYGVAGTGKTTLAKESSAIYGAMQRPQPSLFRVDLRKRSNVTDAGVALLTSVGRQVAAKDFDMSMITEWVNSCVHQENVIVMDNADELLQPLSMSRDHFINMMTDVLMTRNAKVKLILTSRYAIRSSTLNDKPNFEEIEVRALEVRESIQLLVRECRVARGGGDVDERLSDKTAEEIANNCGNNPQALRAVAKRLKSGMSPEGLAEKLRKPHLAGRVLDPGLVGSTSLGEDGEEPGSGSQKLVLQSLKATFDMLPGRLQEALVRLSVFPGTFDRQKAALILGIGDLEAVDLEIDDLRQWSLVECEEYKGFEHHALVEDSDRQYTIHQLIRTVCMLEGMKGERHNAAFADALERMCLYVSSLMQEMSVDGHKEYTRALVRFEEEKPIVVHYMEMDMGETFSGFKVPSQLLEEEDSTRERAMLSTSTFADSIYNLFECFLDFEKLEKYFRCKTAQMKTKGEMEAWALLSGWLADQYVVQAKYPDVWEILKEPLEWLSSLPQPLSKDADLAKAQCQAIYGRYLADKPNPDYKQSIKVLEEALKIRKKHLGSNTLTGRCLNFLGHTYHRKGDPDKAKSYHEQAWQMLNAITEGKPEQHFDAPLYALNIGSAYHQLGNRELDKNQRQKACEYFRHAISFFDRAQEIEKRLRLEGNPNTAVILKNKAMSYCEMKEYENALPLAVKASEYRKKGLGTHPDTARSLYFVGSLYESLGKKQKKASNTPEEGTQSFEEALKYYKEALKMEFKLGPERRSWEYEHLKNDFKKLLTKHLHDTRQLQSYERLFHQADKGSLDSAIPEKPKEAEEEDEGASTSSGSPKRKLPGLEDMPESPKRSRCILA